MAALNVLWLSRGGESQIQRDRKPSTTELKKSTLANIFAIRAERAKPMWEKVLVLFRERASWHTPEEVVGVRKQQLEGSLCLDFPSRRLGIPAFYLQFSDFSVFLCPVSHILLLEYPKPNSQLESLSHWISDCPCHEKLLAQE